MYTNEQLEATNTTGVNITVSASAGAGKTAVLVERLMKRIIQDEISVDKIVALTFTDAAAAEMKNRLMDQLLKKQKQQPNNEYINEQITLLPNANISTIHSFCLNILKDYYYILAMNPERLNNILSESEEWEISEASFKYLLENYDNHKIGKVVNRLSNSNNGLNILHDLIKNLIREANATTDPNQFLDNSIKIYNNYQSIEQLPKPFKAMFFKYHQDHFKQLTTISYQLARIIDQAEKADTQRTWINEVINKLKIIEIALSNEDYNTYQNQIIEIAKLKNRAITKNEAYKKARDTYYDILNSIVSVLYPESELLSNLSKNKDFSQTLIEMTKIYNEHYLHAIEAANKITFNDMETLTYKLITKNDNEVAKILQSQISDILIDEFQDTNTLQNAIIEKLSSGNNIFRVGDVKQSIYRFRGAKPQIMQDLINQPDSKQHKTIYLSNNFRSKHSIVEYTNHFFDNLMNLESFDSTYTKADYVTVGTPQQKQDNQQVKLHLINNEQETYADLDEDYNLTTDEFKANFIAAKILDLYNQDKEKRWSKYTVLVESHNRKLSLKAAFDKANIPYFIAFPDGLFDSLGVSVTVAYLKLIYNPEDTLSLMAILTNLYNYSENEIAKLFIKYQDLQIVADKLNPKLYQDVKYFNKIQNQIPLQNIVNHIFKLNNFYEQQISKQSRTNTDLFYDIVVEYDEQHSGILGFLDLIKQLSNTKASEGSSISSEDNVVNVMTIHNSKGLQFDTVFLFSKSSIRKKQTNNYLIHPEYGLAIKTLDEENRNIQDNLANFTINYFDEQELLEEEMRKLYVAMTRAQNDLYIIDTIKLKEAEERYDFNADIVRNKKGFTIWLLALQQNLPHQFLEYETSEILEFKAARKQYQKIIQIPKLTKTKTTPQRPDSFIPSPLDFGAKQLGVDIGTLVHNTIEQLTINNYEYDYIKTISPDLPDYYVDKIINLGTNELFKTLNQFDIYHEFPFIIVDEFNYQQGFIDFLSVDDNDIYIVDFKTDNLEYKADFLDRYNQQLTGYIQAVKQIYPNRDIHTYIYSFNLDMFIPFKVD